jgi:hypothetical protein
MTRSIKLSKIVFLDLEASGLGDRCYPIEVGIVRAADLSGWSALIRPAWSWRQNGRWEAKAEALHGISQAEVETEGWDVVDVARGLNEQLVGMAVFSDAADFDGHWLEMLFKESMEHQTFDLFFTAALFNNCRQMVEVDCPIVPMPEAVAEPNRGRRHRAKEDALDLAMEFRKAIGISVAKS